MSFTKVEKSDYKFFTGTEEIRGYEGNAHIWYIPGKGWGFWDETQSNFYGGCFSPSEAKQEMTIYCEWLDNGDYYA